MEGKEPTMDRETLVSERKKIISNLVLLLAASLVVLLAFATLAWFKVNKELKGSGLQVFMSTPESVQISLGKTNGSASNPVYPHDAESLLDLSGGAIAAPRNKSQDGSDSYDWAQYIEVSNYYAFGRLFPASSDTGEHIIFTPDGAEAGRELKSGARFYRADGYTDGQLALAAKGIEKDDQDSLMATAYPFSSVDEKSTEDFGGNYVRSMTWHDTNDDGYYVDIPLWFRTDFQDPAGIKLAVEGYVTNMDDEVAGADEYALYKAVRVAFLKENESGELTAVVEQAAGEEPNGNLIPLKNANAFGVAGTSILDSENYTVSRGKDPEHPENCYGLRQTDADGIVQNENYQSYNAYNGNTPVISFEPTSSTGWSEAAKYWVRIWLDGDDGDCYNVTAGQDWKIHLRFYRIDQD